MSDALKHECGIALIRLLKPLEYYKEKYGTAFYGVNKMYLMMEKQHNRGQDGAGFASIKLDTKPGERYISRVRSIEQQPIQDIFAQINERINQEISNHPEYKDNVALQKKNIPYIGEVLLGHVRYGTFGKNSVESVHPFLRQNNWTHRNLILAGNFNMTNVKELFSNLVELGQHPKEYTDTITIMEIRPAYYYKDDEVVVVASERPVIQTVFNVDYDNVKELPPGNAIIIKKSGETNIKQIIEPLERKACSFERIYFSRGSDAEIYQERKHLGKLLMPKVLEAIEGDTKNSVFSYIPNTAETSFFGMIESVEDHLNEQKTKAILSGQRNLSAEKVTEILSERPRIEKIAIKDVKLRTFITEDSSRDDLVAHVYDVTYGVIKPTDNLVIIDDSIVRGTTLKKSIIKMMDRLNAKKIVVVSSAPQIRYPDCYGIDMARLEDLVAFRAALALLKDNNKYDLVEEVYKKCKAQTHLDDSEVTNFVKEIYDLFTELTELSLIFTKEIRSVLTNRNYGKTVFYP